MIRSMSFKNFNKVLAVATVLATTSCLIPESAQAIKLGFSGEPNAGEVSLEFILNTSVQVSTTPDNVIFQGAIEEAKYTCRQFDNFGCDDENQSEYTFTSGDLSPSLTDLGVRYDARLTDADSNVLYLAIRVPSDEPQLFSSLSDLSQFLQTGNYSVAVELNQPFRAGAFVSASDTSAKFKVMEIPDSISVPEPDATGGLLSAGVISALLLMKRIRRSRKLTQSGLTVSKI